MKRFGGFVLFFIMTFASIAAEAQCSICTKTASQLGKEAASGLNSGIIYLMILPFAVGGYIAFRWWRQEKNINE